MEEKLSYGKGYAGKLGEKCWIAAISGHDNRYGLKREFIEPVKVEREHFNRPRTIIHFTFELSPGLYEVSEHGERHFIIVWINKSGEHEKFLPTENRIREMLQLMDDGLTAEEARKATVKKRETS